MTGSHFVAFELHPIRDLGDIAEVTTDGDADFWSVYGVLPTRDLVCIGDYDSRDAAELVLWLLDG